MGVFGALHLLLSKFSLVVQNTVIEAAALILGELKYKMALLFQSIMGMGRATLNVQAYTAKYPAQVSRGRTPGCYSGGDRL